MGQKFTKELITILECYSLERDVRLTVELKKDLDQKIAALKKELLKQAKKAVRVKANRVSKQGKITVRRKKITKEGRASLDFAKGILERYLEHEAVKTIIGYLSHYI